MNKLEILRRISELNNELKLLINMLRDMDKTKGK